MSFGAPAQQQPINGFGTAVASSALTAVPAGSFVLVEVTNQLASGNATSVTDDVGNTYTQVVVSTTGVSQKHLEHWYCPSTTVAGMTVVTVNNAAGTNVGGNVIVWATGSSGLVSSNALNNASSATPPAATVVPQSGYLVVGSLAYQAAVASTRQDTLADAAYTALTPITRGTTTMHASAYQIASSTTATGPSWAMSPAVSTAELTSVFAPVASGSTNVQAVAFTATAAMQAPAVSVTSVVSGGGPFTATMAMLAPTVTGGSATVLAPPVQAVAFTATAMMLAPTVTADTPVVVPTVTYLGSSRASLGPLDFGVLEAGGVGWTLTDIQGWGSPASTIQVTQRPRANGGWAGPAYLPARTISLTGFVDAPSTLLAADAIDRLSAACSLTDTTLTVIEGGRARTCTVRRQGEVLVSWLPGSDRAANWSIQLVALDPRKYGPTLTKAVSLPTVSGGATFPATFPLAFTGVTNSGVVSVTNPGNIKAPVTIRIDGPVVAPTITHFAGGVSQVWSTSLTLAQGEFLLIDMERKSVLANGQSSRAGYVSTPNGWFGADPGSNQFAFNAQTYNSSARMTVTVPSGAWS